MQFDSCISDASAFIQKLQADTSDNTIRCPYLGNLEVERRKHLYGKGDDEKLMGALMQYFFRYILQPQSLLCKISIDYWTTYFFIYRV